MSDDDIKQKYRDALLAAVAFGEINQEEADREIAVCKALDELILMGKMEDLEPVTSPEARMQRKRAMIARWPEACRRAGVPDMPADILQAVISRVGPWHGHWLELVPYRFSEAELTCGRSIPIKHADEAEQRTVLEALLLMPWLPPAIRVAVHQELGRPLQAEKVKNTQAMTVLLEVMIAEREAEIRKTGKRAPGSVSILEEAIADVAEAQGMEVGTLKKRLQPNRRRSRK